MKVHTIKYGDYYVLSIHLNDPSEVCTLKCPCQWRQSSSLLLIGREPLFSISNRLIWFLHSIFYIYIRLVQYNLRKYRLSPVFWWTQTWKLIGFIRILYSSIKISHFNIIFFLSNIKVGYQAVGGIEENDDISIISRDDFVLLTETSCTSLVSRWIGLLHSGENERMPILVSYASGKLHVVTVQWFINQ